ncbi:MAG: nitroreductase family protein [Bacillota bacterium]
MDIFDVIEKRRSIRKYEKKEIEKEKLKKVLETAHLAPSAKNAQPWKVLLVDNDRLKQGLVEAAKEQRFLLEAPYIVVMCVNRKECYQEHGDYMTSFAVDGAIFVDHLTLAARALGLGTCWIAKFNETKVKELLNIPADFRVVVMTPLGYPAESGKDKGRKPLSEILYENTWGKRSFEF